MELLYEIELKLRKNARLRYLWMCISKLVLDLIYATYLRSSYRFRSELGIIENNYGHKNVVVSLTTFPQRIKTAAICIETIMRQQYKPNQIILWLSKEQFKDKSQLPKHISNLVKRGLTIKYCDDLRSHKKYFYAMQQMPNSIIITLDDDVYYPNYTVKKLIDTYLKNEDCIICNNAKRINFVDGRIREYQSWKMLDGDEQVKGYDLLPIGVSGVLYPPNSLNDKLFDKKFIKENCIHTDDLWLKTMSLMNNTNVIYNGRYPILITINSSQKSSLSAINCEYRNDDELANIMDTYGDAYIKLMRKEKK